MPNVFTLKFLASALVTGFIIAAASEIIGRSPRFGSLLLTMPIIIPAIFVVAYLRQPNLAPISRSAREMLALIPLALPFFIPLALAERLGLSFWPALAAGFVLVGLGVGIYLYAAT